MENLNGLLGLSGEIVPKVAVKELNNVTADVTNTEVHPSVRVPVPKPEHANVKITSILKVNPNYNISNI